MERLDISDWIAVGTEQGGQSSKMWVQPPADSIFDGKWLFKPVAMHENGGRQATDWSERAAYDLSMQIDVPATTIEVVSFFGVDGSISRSFKPAGEWEDQTGALRILNTPRCGATTEMVRRSNRRNGASPAHTLSNIHMATQEIGPPLAHEPTSALSGYDVLCGYLILDAWMGNQDRHEENWSVLVNPYGEELEVRLAPSYDHVGLGYQLLDDDRRRMLNDSEALTRFVERGSAQRIWSEPTYSLVGLVSAALQLASAAGRAFWMDRISALDEIDAAGLTAIPGMSEVGSNLAIEVLKANARRLKDEFASRTR